MYVRFIKDWRGYEKGYEGHVPVWLGRVALRLHAAVRAVPARQPYIETAVTGPPENAALRTGKHHAR